MNKEPTIEEIRAQIEGAPGEFGAILGTYEEAALDFFNRLDPNLIILVFYAKREQEEHADEMKAAYDKLMEEAEAIANTLETGKKEKFKALLSFFSVGGEFVSGWDVFIRVHKDDLPEQFIEKASALIDTYNGLHPVTVILRQEYENDAERKEQAKARGELLRMIMQDEDTEGDSAPAISYNDYVNTITLQDLKKCATACRKAARKGWADQFSALAKVWDEYDTPTRKKALKALKDEQKTDPRLTFEVSVYLFRCVKARLENQPPAPVPEDTAETALYKDDTFYLPINQISRQLFTKDEQGQIQFIPEVREGKAPEMICCDFSALPEDVRKKLTPFDKRVLCAYYSLARIQKEEAPADPYKAITTADLCRRMKIDPDKRDNRKKAFASMEKCRRLPITLHILNDFTGTYEIVYNDYLAPCAVVKGINRITGEMIDGCFLPKVSEGEGLANSPVPYITFAESQKAITAIDSKYLATPWQSTDNHIAVEDYILRRVQQYKNHEAKGEAWENSRTIILDEIFKECNITDRRVKDRLREDINKKLLPFYVQEGYFTLMNCDFRTTKDKDGNPLKRDDFKGLQRFTFKVNDDSPTDPRRIVTHKK